MSLQRGASAPSFPTHTHHMRTFLVSALVASASAFSGIAPAPAASKLSISKVAARTPLVEMQASSKATVIGAGAVGGIVGIYLTGELQSGLILGSVLAYASTTASQFGKYSESAGETAVKVYDKTLELNAQYDLLPKVRPSPGPRPRPRPHPNSGPRPYPDPRPRPRSESNPNPGPCPNPEIAIPGIATSPATAPSPRENLTPACSLPHSPLPRPFPRLRQDIYAHQRS